MGHGLFQTSGFDILSVLENKSMDKVHLWNRYKTNRTVFEWICILGYWPYNVLLTTSKKKLGPPNSFPENETV